MKEKLSPSARYQLGELLARSISLGVRRAGLTPQQIISDAGQAATAIRVQTETGAEYTIPVHRLIQEGCLWYRANRIPNETPLPATDTNRGVTEVEKPFTPKRRKTRLKIVPSQGKLVQ